MTDKSQTMAGFPPAPEHQVTLANWRDPPLNRWAFRNVSQIVPSAMVWRGAQGSELPANGRDLGDVTFSFNGETLSVQDMLERSLADGFVVVHDGRIVQESYLGGLKPHVPHILFSVTKSIVGLLAGILVGRGDLDPDAQLTTYIRELETSGYADATVRHLLDMTASVDFDEDYLATEGDMVRYREASGWNPGGAGDTGGLRLFLPTLSGANGHGKVFQYCSPNTDLLGWVLERAADQPFPELLSEALWAPMGAENNAYIGVDGLGAPRAAGGLCATTRDLARIGQLLLDDGRAMGNQVVPADWIRDIFENGDREAWKGGSFAEDMPDAWYRSKWYKHGEDAFAVSGLGIYGQSVFIHPASRTVIAKHASQITPLDFDIETMQQRGVSGDRGGVGVRRARTLVARRLVRCELG